MDIVLIGSGHVATVMGRKALGAGHRILQVYSRHAAHASLLAVRLNTVFVISPSDIEKNADLTIMALPDSILPSFASELGEIESILAHTAGAISIDVLKPFASRYGVLYPLQSLRKEIELMPPITMLVDGSRPETKEQLSLFASSISEETLEANDSVRLKYHLAATVVNNFSNHLFAAAESFCKKENISFAVLQPIIEETVKRLRYVSPADAQTGPAVRDDRITLKKHRDLLKSYPSLLPFYDLFTREIQNLAAKQVRT
jgi:predicted short-subunit dehydrogenase-like oxidoreductase (DUF2520 family)